MPIWHSKDPENKLYVNGKKQSYFRANYKQILKSARGKEVPSKRLSWSEHNGTSAQQIQCKEKTAVKSFIPGPIDHIDLRLNDECVSQIGSSFCVMIMVL